MRGFKTLSISILLTCGFSASAWADAPDLGPLVCAWEKLPAVEQARLRDEFKVELKDKNFTLLFAEPNAASAADAARACQLTVTPAQTEQLALGLSRHAAVEKAKKGIADKGEDPGSLQKALEKMHEGKREVIGDKLACPGPQSMVTEWDESVRGAVRRANLGFKDGRAYSWVSMGLYAIFAEEGAMRRMMGKADACS